MHSGHCKTLHSTKHSRNRKKSENPLRGSTSCAASLRRAVHQMMGLRQILQDHQTPKERNYGVTFPGSDCRRVCRSGTEVSSNRRQSPWVNLRRPLCVGAWNVLSRREDDHLSLLSSELKRLKTLAAFENANILQHSLRFGEQIVARLWQVVTPTIGLVDLMVTMPKELL